MTGTGVRQDSVRLTQYAHGGGCACKIPPGELEEMVAGLAPGARRASPGTTCSSAWTPVTTPPSSGFPAGPARGRW